jgi:hypothetical protein
MSLLVAAAAAAFTAAALATAPPVGPLPPGPTKAVAVKPNHTFVITLLKSKNAGLVWRSARNYDGTVVREVKEGETRSTVWLRFTSVGTGKTSLVFALTRGERTHAFAARTFRVTVG